MKVQCGQCPAKYAVSDERIRDKKVRIRCKRCNAAIVVDGSVDPPLVTSTPARRSARPAPASVPPDGVPPAADREPESRPSPRPVAHTIMGGLEAPAAERLREVSLSSNQSPSPGGKGAPVPGSPLLLEPQLGMPGTHRGLTDPPAGAVADRWRVALTKQDLRWMTTSEIAEAYEAGAVKLETFVIRAGMPSWVTLLEVPEIAQALAEAQSEVSDSPTSPPARRAPSSHPPPRRAAAKRSESSGDRFGDTGLPHAEEEPEAPFALVSGRGTEGHDRAHRSDVGEEAASSPSMLTEAGHGSSTETPVAAASAMAAWSSEEIAEEPRQNADWAPTEASLFDHGEPIPPPATAAFAARSSSRWIWIVIALLLAGAAAAALLGPRFGLKLL